MYMTCIWWVLHVQDILFSHPELHCPMSYPTTVVSNCVGIDTYKTWLYNNIIVVYIYMYINFS